MKQSVETAVRNGGPKARMVSFKIIWSESSGRFDGRVFNTWESANSALKVLAREHEKDNCPGYMKVKVQIDWSNGHQIVDRLDISKKDFWPLLETAGEYLSRINSVMYASTLQVGDRSDLMWSDTDFDRSGPTMKQVIDMQAETYMWN